MSILTMQKLLLIAHLSGLVLMVGTTVTEFVAFRILTVQVKVNKQVPDGIMKLLSSLTAVLTAGGILLTISGIGLAWITAGIFLHQLWLQLKLSLVVLLALNGMLFGGKQMKHLQNSWLTNSIDNCEESKDRIIKINIFYSIQLLFFLAIVALAVFKPN
ncbi:DUF2214 family protein [Mucilaginibacter gilvus]|uniref:DUF2214 family protein n=1 Tax=Mucilaginibacter gilvus TaxID=2305909 RepID=A0A444MQE3_9SPHI|nr:DUF2214 family protein [Mucilaginibacter gilvus]RWY53876.1 DUF2214 family protein [Mucilaginibacter gilvus]